MDQALNRMPLAALGLTLLALGEGWAVATGEKKIVAISVAPILVAALARRPWWPIMALMLFVAVADPTHYRFGQATVAFLLLLAGLAAIACRGHLPRLEPIGIALSLLLLTTLIGVYVGARTVGTHQALLAVRLASLFPAYWLALAAFQRDRDRTLAALGKVAALVSALAVAQWLTGPSTRWFFNVDLRDQDGLLRVRPPGQMLPYLALIFAASYLLSGPRRYQRRVVALTALTLVATLLTLNRDMIVGTVAGLLVAFVLARPNAAAMMKGLVIGIVAAMALAVGSGSPLGQRILSLGKPHYLQQTTLSDRQYEDMFAKETLHHHPILGIGWGADYGASFVTVENHVNVVVPRGFIHNQYLGVWLRDGIVGLAALLVMLRLGFRYGVRFSRHADDEHAWIGSAVVASVVATALSSIVGIFILDGSSSVIWLTVLALAATLTGQSVNFAFGGDKRPASAADA